MVRVGEYCMPLSVSRQVEKIESIAERKIEEIQDMEYEKYNYLFRLAIRFLKKENVLMYGGTALNELLPDKLKFYGKNELPDIDVFAIDARKVAMHVVHEFQNRGYSFASFREALHENTYKVFVEGIQVLDITNISQATYKRLVKGHIRSKTMGLKIANPEYLRYTLHNMLSHPFDAYRWPKVFKRLAYFYTTFPMKSCNLSFLPVPKRKSHVPQEVIEKFKTWVKNNDFVLFGGPEVNQLFFGGNLHTYHHHDIYVSGTDSLTTYAQEFISVLPPALRRDVSLSDVYPGDELMITDHIHVNYKGKKAFGIHKNNVCISYVENNGFRIASFHTLCATYMGMALSPYKHQRTDTIKCIIHALGGMQMSLLKKPSKMKALNQFVLTCDGPYAGLVTLRRKQMERMNK
jgi:hypothetical protein